MKAENQNIEYKESWRDEYLKWICGFANAQGGTLFVGISDDGDVVGLRDAKKLMEDIPNKVSMNMGILVDVNLCEQDGRVFLNTKRAVEALSPLFRERQKIKISRKMTQKMTQKNYQYINYLY